MGLRILRRACARAHVRGRQMGRRSTGSGWSRACSTASSARRSPRSPSSRFGPGLASSADQARRRPCRADGHRPRLPWASTSSPSILLPLAEATAIGFSVPIFSTLLAALLLARTDRRRGAGARCSLGFVGVLVIVQPGGGHIALTGGLVAIAAAFVDRLRDHRHPPARRDRGRGDHRLLVRRQQR